MNCRYCFAKFGCEENYLSRDDSLLLIERIAEAGCKKISFAGGEPTLCEWLTEAVVHAKKCDLVTVLISNGSGITDAFLREMAGHLDWIGLSVDTLNKNQLEVLGRQLPHESVDGAYYYDKINKINKYGYKLKINTVVSNINKDEDLSEFINYANPRRWKIFQFLPIDVIRNDCSGVIVSRENFFAFCERHTELVNTKADIVIEDNDTMINSYVFMDQAGRFVDNSNYTLRYSEPILDVGVMGALGQISVREEKIKNRNAIYDWY